MSLYDILACPNCRVRVYREGDLLFCEQCKATFPIINNVPVMFPDGSIPSISHEAELATLDSYNPWVHRVILQSLLDNQIVLDVGSGNMALDDPCIIRMDVTLSPYVDLVADLYTLPFLPESLDYVFSLAVFEHLRNPFLAAQSIFESLKDGGFVFHECNFVFAYHGFPYHYFNASLQGMEQIFADFVPLRKGVGPHQMPSFALEMVIGTYLRYSHANDYPHGQRIVELLNYVIHQELRDYDIYFSEEEALNVAAGTYFAGIKQESPESTLIPPAINSIWERDDSLKERFPHINQLTTTDNILVWAKGEGRREYPEIAAYLDNLVPFNKRGKDAAWDRTDVRSLPLVEPQFGAIGFDLADPMPVKAQQALERRQQREEEQLQSSLRNVSLMERAFATLKHDGLRIFIVKTLEYIARRLAD